MVSDCKSVEGPQPASLLSTFNAFQGGEGNGVYFHFLCARPFCTDYFIFNTPFEIGILILT